MPVLGPPRRHCNRDADGTERQDEGIFGRGRAALVLPKPLEEVTHGQSPFLGWFPVPPPDRFCRARAGCPLAWGRRTACNVYLLRAKIGRASCRERVCYYVLIQVGAVSLIQTTILNNSNT